MVTTLDRDEVQAKIASGTAVLLEALPPAYYADAHLPGALNLPHDRVDELAPALVPDTDTEVVVYCANGPCQNSGIAARRLAALGYTRVYDYALGKQDWVDAGLPTETGVAAR